MPKKKYMICPDKLTGKCNNTGEECDHAVKHKLGSWCYLADSPCPECIPYEPVRKKLK